jgi:hypothetical protein
MGGNHFVYNEILILLIKVHADVNVLDSESQSASIIGIILLFILF